MSGEGDHADHPVRFADRQVLDLVLAHPRRHGGDVDFDRLIERAERQRAELEPFRARAGREAFTAPTA